jgi:hypothetical protein
MYVFYQAMVHMYSNEKLLPEIKKRYKFYCVIFAQSKNCGGRETAVAKYYTHATWSCNRFLGNGSVNTFPLKRIRATRETLCFCAAVIPGVILKG